MDWTPDEIRRRRDAKGLSQEELGRRLGEHLDKPVSRRAITNWENGASTPHGRNLRALDLVLGDQPAPNDPPLSQATFMETLAHLANLYAQAAGHEPQTRPIPLAGAARYKIRTEDIPDPEHSAQPDVGETGESRN